MERIARAFAHLMLVATVVACRDATGASEIVSVTPAQTQVTLLAWSQSGMPGTFVNRGLASVVVSGRSCDGRGTSIDRWTGFVWSPVPDGPQVMACPLMLVDNTVPPGGSLGVYAASVPSEPGRYRLRLSTSGGDAVSGPIEVR